MRQVILSSEIFHGAISLERSEQGIKPWRIPFADIELFPPNGLTGHAGTPAGVRLRFASDTVTIQLQLVASDKERLFDCVINKKIVQTQHLLANEQGIEFANLSAGPKVIEIYLPQTTAVTIVSLAVDDQAAFEPSQDAKPRWIAYGSSVTQCVTAASPAETWPAIVAREQELSLTCLGYRGNCHMEPMVARMIRELPADIISLCLGINIYGSESLSLRTFRAMMIGFIQIIREKHSETPIVIISPIISPPREEVENKAGLTLVIIRREMEAAISLLRQHGASNLFYIDGLELFGSEFVNYLPDNLHPDAQGYRVLADRIQKMMAAQGILQQVHSEIKLEDEVKSI